MRKAVVLGARAGSGNIGAAIAAELSLNEWAVSSDDCLRGSTERPKGAAQFGADDPREHGYEEGYSFYDAPSFDQFERWDADALVITLGATYKEHFTEVKEHEFTRVLRGCLELPLRCALRYVQAVDKLRGEHESETPPDKCRLRRIVFLGSYAHRHPFTNGTAYCAAKAGLDMAARTLGWELTDRGYRVFIVHPYHIPGTPMWAEVEKGVMESKGWTKEEADAYAHRDLKMPDLCTPREVAEVVADLLDGGATDWLSGTALELNGGTR